ncbi:BESS motif [Nesidiocoris tenuis]|uniref:BESS motif n=1 Tax=Nesidiocoris tenuis TaxID=355587 RepID=A0ABN7BA78_9HEMI|nr:BESS motif [Nesidiocoris tenuis]
MEKLISEVKKREVLWNKHSINYRNKKQRDLAWQAVAAESGFPEEQARREWKSLRDMFTKHLKKVEPTASSDDDAEKPRAYNGKWKYFHSLSFLTNIKIDGTADDSNEPVAPKEDDKVEILDASQIVVCQLSTNKVDEKPKIAPNLISSLDLQRRPLVSAIPSAARPVHPLPLRKPDLPPMRTDLNDFYARWESDRADWHFVQSLLPYLKRMNSAQKLRTKATFFNILRCELPN